MNKFGDFKVESNQNYVYHGYRRYNPVLCVYDAAIAYPDSDYRYTRDMRFKAYLFEYIVSGKGWIECGGRRYAVGAGDCVFINRDTHVSYGSDREEPYTKLWFSTDGALTGKLCEAFGFEGDVLIRKCNLYEKFHRFLNILENDGFELERASKHLVGIMLSIFTESCGENDAELSLLEQIKTYIDTFIESPPTVGEIADRFGICSATVIRRFKKEYGETPNEYISRRRMSIAESMLRNSDYTVSKISQLLNFCSQSYFSESFFECFGMYPTEYRKSLDKKL